MKYLIIYTNEYGPGHYVIDLSNGNIVQSARFNGGRGFSNQWKFRGFRHATKPKIYISLEQIQADPKVLEVMSWRFLNGKGQYRICDLDYGTRREWGSRVQGCYFSDKGD